MKKSTQQSKQQKRSLLPSSSSSFFHRSGLLKAIIALLFVSIWFIGAMVWSHFTLHNTTPKASPKVVSPHQIAEHSLLEDLWPDDTKDSFFEALTSCYEDCNSREQKTANIGILFPPGGMGLVLVDYIQLIVRAHSSSYYSQQQRQQEEEEGNKDNGASWISTTHIPPNPHYYSHIIRFATLPILLAVGDALLSVATPEEITWTDVEEAAELIISWHCWISNLVTATEQEDSQGPSIPILTMTMEQLEDSPLEIETVLRDYLGILDPYYDDPEGHVDTTELTSSIQQMVDKIKKPLLNLDKTLRKEQKKKNKKDKDPDNHNTNLEVVVNHVIRKYLTEDLECPKLTTTTTKHGNTKTDPHFLHDPKSNIVKRLYDAMLPLQQEPEMVASSSSTTTLHYDADVKMCQTNKEISSRLFCMSLTKPFSIQSLTEKQQ